MIIRVLPIVVVVFLSFPYLFFSSLAPAWLLRLFIVITRRKGNSSFSSSGALFPFGAALQNILSPFTLFTGLYANLLGLPSMSLLRQVYPLAAGMGGNCAFLMRLAERKLRVRHSSKPFFFPSFVKRLPGYNRIAFVPSTNWFISYK